MAFIPKYLINLYFWKKINTIPSIYTNMKWAAHGYVAWYVVASILEESTFRIENGGSMFIWNVGNRWLAL